MIQREEARFQMCCLLLTSGVHQESLHLDALTLGPELSIQMTM